MSGFYSRVIFPRLMDVFMSGRTLGGWRQAALSDIRGRALEIGFGTGLNLPSYPVEVESLVAVDSNEGVEKIARRRIAASPLKVEYHTMSGEALPMEDGSFDSVVTTCALCSIPEVEKALSEARRVLKPGGVFFFLEHGRSDDEAARRWQRRLNPIQKIIGDGCHLDRDIEQLVKDSGLEIVRLEKFLMDDGLWLVPRTIKNLGQMYMGAAVKR
ncbi:MAG: class I SAM-dependent methyltransferase [Candidatus Nitrospinota bacterium M3_3B_026]